MAYVELPYGYLLIFIMLGYKLQTFLHIFDLNLKAQGSRITYPEVPVYSFYNILSKKLH